MSGGVNLRDWIGNVFPTHFLLYKTLCGSIGISCNMKLCSPHQAGGVEGGAGGRLPHCL